MISRYENKDISRIWSEHNKFTIFLKVELAILQAFEEKGLTPKSTTAEIAKKAVINVSRIDEIEKTVKHDVIAFTTSITENLPAELGKFFHFGVTSSDIIDTALTIQVKESINVILPIFKRLLTTLSARANELKDVMTIGRSHGMYAEPFSFGQKLLGHYCEFYRRYQELKAHLKFEMTAQFSGAVGNYTIVNTELESRAAQILGLKPELVSTQIIPRDRIAKIVSTTALLASAIERLCVELRHLHRNEVGEFEEGFSKGQKGSSIMPHKKNPISGENLTGLARMLRSHQQIALENIVLWHERDISHSSTERLYLPDHFGLLAYALDRLASTIENGIFHKNEIEKKVWSQYTYLSSFYLHQLIEQTNVKREELYYFVQEAAFKAKDSSNPESFTEALSQILKDKGITATIRPSTKDEIRKIYLGNVNKVFERSMTEYPLHE